MQLAQFLRQLHEIVRMFQIDLPRQEIRGGQKNNDPPPKIITPSISFHLKKTLGTLYLEQQRCKPNMLFYFSCGLSRLNYFVQPQNLTNLRQRRK